MTGVADPTHRRALHLARAYYFFYFGAIGCLLPYAGLYFERVGLSGTQIGLLISLLPLGVIVAGPLLGALADRFRLHRVLLPLASFVPVPAVLLMALTTSFAALLGLMAVVACFATPANALIDSTTLELLEGDAQAFGRVRLGGTFGFVSLTLVTGAAIDAFGPASLFVGYALCLGLAGAVAVWLPARRRELQSSYGAGVRALLGQSSLVLLLVGSLLLGGAVQAFYSFFSLHLQTLGASAQLIGFAAALTSISELPVLLLAQRVLARLGPWASVTIGAAVYIVRWLLLALAVDPITATVIQTVHGLSFGLVLVGGVAFVDARTPSGLSATAQALFSAALNGLGAVIGSLAGGYVYERSGGSVMFLWAAGACVLGLMFILAARGQQSAVPLARE